MPSQGLPRTVHCERSGPRACCLLLFSGVPVLPFIVPFWCIFEFARQVRPELKSVAPSLVIAVRDRSFHPPLLPIRYSSIQGRCDHFW
ncbi:hypothetical protein BDV06DRAFT_198236 [Aspergillus oleicola]